MQDAVKLSTKHLFHQVQARQSCTRPHQRKALQLGCLRPPVILAAAASSRLRPSGGLQFTRAQHSDSRQSKKDLDRDFILSILQAQPSARDSRSYLKAFASEDLQAGQKAIFAGKRIAEPKLHSPGSEASDSLSSSSAADTSQITTDLATSTSHKSGKDVELVDALLNPVTKHTAIVKVQGPFTPRQLTSIAEGLVYLERLGLVSIVVVDDERWSTDGLVGAGSSQLRKEMISSAHELVEAVESIGGKALPMVNSLFQLGDVSQDQPETSAGHQSQVAFTTAARVGTLDPLRAAISRGEMPVITPVAYDSGLAAVAVPANDAIKALVAALARDGQQKHVRARGSRRQEVDLTPYRMMIINREGGIPSPARGGNPHLSINLESEYEYIHDTFVWHKSHPTSLSNLALLRSCLFQLPRESSAVIVSHRSPKSLIANLITNRPAHSPSLHHSLLPAKHITHTPTTIRRGHPMRVIRSVGQLDLPKLTKLLEASFGKTLDASKYYGRLDKELDFVIVAGEGERDYQAAAIVTRQRDPNNHNSLPITYLDKFAVLPSLQGDGTVDFLWTALRDETFGLGLLDALNPNGGKEGIGLGTDLVWRSRADNPVNKWYFERSNGFMHIPEMGSGGTPGTMFWADAEDRLVRQMEASQHPDASPGSFGLSASRGSERQSISMVMREEEGRLARWARIIGAIKSCWV